MNKLVVVLAVTMPALFTGCQSQSTNSEPENTPSVAGDSVVNPKLKELFERHNLHSGSKDDWLIFTNGIHVAGALVHEQPPSEGLHQVQLEIYIKLHDERVIVESFAGTGKTREDAIDNGMNDFATNALHVILSSIFNTNTQLVDIEEWQIGGVRRRVTLSRIAENSITSKSIDPPTYSLIDAKHSIEQIQMPGGKHWFRCYFAQVDGQLSAVQVLVDNNKLDPLIETPLVEWPANSLRVFAVIQDLAN